MNGITSQYSYTETGHPYAVTSVTNVNGGTYSASYDEDDPWKSLTGDGNMVTRDGDTIEWTADNLPSSLASSLGSSTFDYDPDGARYYQTASLNGVTTDTTYIAGGLFEVVCVNGCTSQADTEYRHSIVADGEVAAVQR